MAARTEQLFAGQCFARSAERGTTSVDAAAGASAPAQASAVTPLHGGALDQRVQETVVHLVP